MSDSIVQLVDVERDVLVQDMEYQFWYNRVYDPDANKTPYFTLSYKESNQPVWTTCNGLLSESFSIAKTEAVISEIQQSLGAEVIGEKHYRHHTSVKSTFLLKDYILDIETDTEVDKILFSLLTNINIEDIQSKTGLAFCIINGFSGNLALQLNYGFITSLFGSKPGDSSKQVKLNVTNPFVLDEFSHRLIHDGTLQLSYSDVANVKDQCSNKINEFKQTVLSTQFMDDFTRLFPKKFVKSFQEIFDELPEEFQNLYYASFIWASFLESAKDINKEINLRRFITAHMAQKKLLEAAE